MAVTSHEQVEPLSFGEQLKRARETLGLDIKSVANNLKLTEKRIVEIESESFDPELSVAFYRGYVRAYALHMKLDEKLVLSSFKKEDESKPLTTISPLAGYESRRKEMNTTSSIYKWITAVILIIGLFFLGKGLKEHFGRTSQSLTASSGELSERERPNSISLDISSREESGTQEKSNDELSEQSSEQQLKAIQAKGSEATEQGDGILGAINSVESNDAKAILTETAKETETESLGVSTETKNENGAVKDELVFAFVGSCWVNVVDASGERLATGIKHDGKVMTLLGLAPFKVKLGDPSVVRIQKNGEPYELAHHGAGKPVTLTIE